ncbi:hypothetical protein DVA67_030855 [Solirubrobacter sp. CPCC 204708]|uniref:DUF6602 domain-containing protein n=1 Tax=Solirubrobacter deserti TaxID=2282478 RepID=A0ABT4RLH2_9ACTN|nr:DUF6602 domain-containing protein [Solirubrobacter deserti]MBE2320403.1 hypothetical protein [Solirubrobacter deserti]MDA0139402.1 hypothetical protein [Solirubrobacter deserti]
MSIVERYWAGVLQRLRAEVEVLSELVRHAGERGRANELALARILEAFLPSRWQVGSGLLIDSHGRYSAQMDIVIQERSDEPAIFAQATELLYPVETVVASIEVKTTLSTPDVTKDFREKKAKLAELEPVTGTRPLFALLAYDCEPSPKTLAGHLRSHESTDAPDLACVLNLCMLAGTATVFASEEYTVGNCLLQERDAAGAWTGAYIEAEKGEKERAVGGMIYPVVRHSDGKRYLGDPGRTLLLFVEALVRAGAEARGASAPTLSAYLSDDARALHAVEAQGDLQTDFI